MQPTSDVSVQNEYEHIPLYHVRRFTLLDEDLGVQIWPAQWLGTPSKDKALQVAHAYNEDTFASCALLQWTRKGFYTYPLGNGAYQTTTENAVFFACDETGKPMYGDEDEQEREQAL